VLKYLFLMNRRGRLGPSIIRGLVGHGRVNVGLSLLDSGDYERPIRAFSRAIEQDPSDVFPYLKRALAYEKRGGRAAAIADYQLALSRADKEGRRDIAARSNAHEGSISTTASLRIFWKTEAEDRDPLAADANSRARQEARIAPLFHSDTRIA
jgi:tetratricopeptide (TPR) repeat protein